MRIGLILTIFSLCLLVGCLLSIEVGDANPYSFPSLWIESPKNTIYNTTDIKIIFHTDTPISYPEIVKMSYSLDGTANRTLSISKSETVKFGTMSNSYNGTGLLTNLSNGSHSIEVYAFDSKGTTMAYPSGRTFQVNITPKSEQPLPISNITIILVITITAVTISSVLTVTLLNRKMKRLTSKQSSL
jgi:hypothetical protein